MSFDAVEKIADAVLFEGYILYPYRPSSIKNQKRWNFGTLFPRGFAKTQSPEESWRFDTEVLVKVSDATAVTARARFLEVASPEGGGEQGWEEGFVRMREVQATLQEMCEGVEHCFDLSELTEQEKKIAPDSHRKQPMVAWLSLRAERIRAGVYRLHASFANETPGGGKMSRVCAQRCAYLSSHLLLSVENGEFVSLLDTEDSLKIAVGECRQQGVFPVLAGDVEKRNCMLCSPIILYDYPQVAPESAGDFFDGTEMDEMLALRVMTLMDDEKAEMRRSDPHARAILERTEMLPQDHLMKIHGAVRGMRPVTETPAEIDGRMERGTRLRIGRRWSRFASLAQKCAEGIACVCGRRRRPTLWTS